MLSSLFIISNLPRSTKPIMVCRFQRSISTRKIQDLDLGNTIILFTIFQLLTLKFITMNNYLIYALLLSINFGCTSVNSQETDSNGKTQDSILIKPTHFNDDVMYVDQLYTSIFRLDEVFKNEYVLSVQMNLKNGSYFASPNEIQNFTGKFTIILAKSEKLSTIGTIIETPLSKGELNNHGSLVNWVRENTNYKQTLKVLSNDDFEVSGYIQFTIEPRCTLEKIPFILSNTNGKLSILIDRC